MIRPTGCSCTPTACDATITIRRLDNAEFEGLAAEILAGGNRLRFLVNGISMRPFIRDGDLVEIEHADGRAARPGQAVFCRLESGRLVIHRILKAGPDGLVVQGDALLAADGKISHGAVLGRVRAVIRGGKRRDLDAPAGRVLMRAWVWITPLRGPLLRFARGLRSALRRSKAAIG